MDIFGTETEQAVLDALSDEALAAVGEEATPDDLPEEVAEDNTEAEAQEAEPETQEEAESEPAAEPREEPETQKEPDTVERSRYEAAVREMNAKQREAAELNRQLEELRKQNKELQDSALQLSFSQPQTEEERAAFLQKLRDNPQGAMFEALKPVLEKMMDQRQQEERRRFDQLQLQQKSDQAFQDAYNKMVGDYPQLKDPEQGAAVLNVMFATAERTVGNGPESWRLAPEMFLREALVQQYGLPSRVDQKAIAEAKKRGYEEGLAQKQQAEAGKAKATPAASTTPDGEQQLSEDERIFQAMMAQTTGSIFGF